MARISANLDTRTALRSLRRIGGIVGKPFTGARGKEVVKRTRAVIRREFSQGGGFNASGGVTRWARTEEFGTRPATVPPLGGVRSSLLQAWQGGEGGSLTIRPNRIELRAGLPYSQIQREGGRIRVTDRMRGFVGAAFGVHFRSGKTHVVIPSRSHADARAPQFVEAARGVLVDAIAKETA